MATVNQQFNIFQIEQVEKGRAYGKAYHLPKQIRIEVGKFAIRLATDEACTLILQLQAAINELNKA
jgi:hypothetical protein